MEIIVRALIMLDRYQMVVVSALRGNRVFLMVHVPPHLPAKKVQKSTHVSAQEVCFPFGAAVLGVRLDSPGAHSLRSHGKFTDGPSEPWTGHRVAP